VLGRTKGCEMVHLVVQQCAGTFAVITIGKECKRKTRKDSSKNLALLLCKKALGGEIMGNK